jgi:tRNA(Ile)-lysidine synthase
VRGLAGQEGISLEMAGRQLRHGFLAHTARAHRIPTIALAHHADDQVELFFLRVFRGTGGRGLAGMKWINPSPADPSIFLVRPLLNQTKAAIYDAVKTAKITYSEDATNAQLDMERNRIRNVLIPFLHANFPGPLAETVPRLMELTGAEAEVVTGLAGQWLSSRKRTKFSRLHVAVQRRAIQLQLIAIGHIPDFHIVERLRHESGKPFALNAHSAVLRDAGGILHERKTAKTSFNPAQRFVVLTEGKGREQMDGLKLFWKIERLKGANFTPKPNVEYFDADKIGERICLRHWQPGDRFQPIGADTPRKLQDLLTNAKIPRAERHRRIVAVTADGEPFWVEGLRISEPFKLTSSTKHRLNWQWSREG